MNASLAWPAARSAVGAVSAPLLSLQQLSVNFGFIKALRDITLDIYPREIVAVVGDNGAGKSTLVKTLGGLVQASSGNLVWKSNPVSISSVHAANSMGIATVFQGQEFCENLDVVSNLFLGREVRTRRIICDDGAMLLQARRVLDSLSSSIRAAASISTLSMGQRQTVAIARTLLNNPDLILLDEPTASLSVMQTAEVLSYIKQLRLDGRAVVLVSHDLPDVFAVADRIVVLRQGRVNGVYRVADTSYEEVIARIAGVAAAADEDWDQIGAVDKMRIRRRLIERTIHEAGC